MPSLEVAGHAPSSEQCKGRGPRQTDDDSMASRKAKDPLPSLALRDSAKVFLLRMLSLRKRAGGGGKRQEGRERVMRAANPTATFVRVRVRSSVHRALANELGRRGLTSHTAFPTGCRAAPVAPSVWLEALPIAFTTRPADPLLDANSLRDQ